MAEDGEARGDKDERIPTYIEAAKALGEGRFDLPASLGAGNLGERDDDVARLGAALRDLALSLEQRRRELAELDAISQSINAGVLLDDILEKFYREAHDILPYERIGFSLLEDGGRVVRARWARSELGPLLLGRGYAAPLAGSSLETILETGRPRILNDLVSYLAAKPHSDSTRLVVAEGVRSSLTCPLVAGGVPIGFIFFSSARPGAYADAHVEIYQRIAGQLSVVVEKGRFISELSEQKAALEVRNRFITRVFGRYLSDAVVEQLLGTPDGLRLGGERRVVTVVMTDLRGFTPLSERLAPEQVVALLNLYLGAMTDVVFRLGGTVDEFIGDAVLAIFGAPLAREDDARRAVRCAVEMQQEMERVHARCRELGLPEVGMGIGVHTGDVVVGNIGSEKRAKYGVVGAAINLASRIQSYTLGGQILASEETIRAAGDEVTTGARFSVHPKGVRDLVSVVEVLGCGEATIEAAADPLTPLAAPVEILVERVGPEAGDAAAGLLRAIGRWEAAVETEGAFQTRDAVRLRFPGGPDVPATVLGSAGRGAGLRVRFGTQPEEAARLFALLAGRA